MPWLGGLGISEAKRVKYTKKNKHLEPIFTLIEKTLPDILVLNEVVYEVYKDEMEKRLRDLGFKTTTWGIGGHYPGARISTLIASKEPSEIIQCVFPQGKVMGSGAGMAGIRLNGVSVFGMHLAYRNPDMFNKQIAYIATLAKNERNRGSEVVFVGDWNESEAVISSNLDFKSIGLISADTQEKLTCPTFLPRFFQKPLDHIFIPAHWKSSNASTIAFGSDHLALMVSLSPK